MPKLHFLTATCLAGLTAFASTTACAQTRIDHDERANAVLSLAQIVEDEYFDAERAGSLAAEMRTALEAGEFDSIRDAETLAQQLTARLHEADRHFSVRYVGERPERVAPETSTQPTPADPWASLRRQNFGFVETSILPGNLGYIRLDQFAPIEPARDTATAVLDFVSNADAVIFDLRQNGGGAPSMVQFLISHFLSAQDPVIINTFVSRDYEYPNQMWSLPSHPSGFRPNVPVYVLVSGRTGSAGEAFPYHLQAMERATIIGETTYGAGNPGEVFRAAGGFGIFVSTGSARNPITMSNWEGTGVTPDIEIPAEDALVEARILAYETLRETSDDPLIRENLEWAASQLRALQNPQVLGDDELAQYVGQFGIRSFSAENGQLIYTRQGRPPEALLALGDHRFAFRDTTEFMLEFHVDGSGAADAVEMQVSDGRRILMPRGE
ncbi:S41 family peptidase [Maricaulis parjimensis]|uniref:S41 family peptidase n=1 Tax=Maricaulis parjimensis TaxID=144023 RepID=UPI0019393A8D|nr:S41 family peptidase [Maricaulis parjimensis]